MSDAALPKIKVTDAPNLEGSSVAASLSPSTTDGGQSGRPRSPTSSEGASQRRLWLRITLVLPLLAEFKTFLCRGSAFSRLRLC